MDVPCTQLQAGAARALGQGRTGGSDMSGDVEAVLFFVGMIVLLIWLVVSFIRSTK
jgi:hypothetical protein